MDGKALFDGSSGARGRGGFEGGAVAGVAPSTVISWVRGFRETGSVESSASKKPVAGRGPPVAVETGLVS